MQHSFGESNHNNVSQFRCIGGVKIFAKYDLPREIFMIFDDVVIKSMTVSHVNTWNTVIQCHEKSWKISWGDSYFVKIFMLPMLAKPRKCDTLSWSLSKHVPNRRKFKAHPVRSEKFLILIWNQVGIGFRWVYIKSIHGEYSEFTSKIRDGQ